MFLVDTNVLSETTRKAPSAAVLQWLERQPRVQVSAVSVMELEHGIERLGASVRREALIQWFEGLLASGAVDVLAIDTAVAREAGRLKARTEAAGRPRPLADLLIAASAHVHGAVVVTRNTADFEGLGVPLLNPFS